MPCGDMAAPVPLLLWHMVWRLCPYWCLSSLLLSALQNGRYIEVSPAFDVDWGRDLGNAFNFRRDAFVCAQGRAGPCLQCMCHV